MSRGALRLGAFDCPGLELVRSGLRWLREDGYFCRAREPAAYCNIAIIGSDAFGPERSDLQVALAPARSGRLFHGQSVAHGGVLDRLPRERWNPDTAWAFLEETQEDSGVLDGETQLTFYAGRRFSDIAEDRSGLLTGWHDRVRAWTGNPGSATLLGAGTCEMEAILRGDDGSFAAMLAHRTSDVQIVVSSGEPLVPSSAVLAGGLSRSAADVASIRADIASTFGVDGPTPTGNDWIFIGALIHGLEQSPLTDQYQHFGRSGLGVAEPASAVCLSLTTEMPPTARHKRLGYALTIHGYRLAAVPPAVRFWLQHHFDFLTRTIEEIARDYAALAAGSRQLFMVNCVSTSRMDNVRSYQQLDVATLRMLSSVRAKELNLMLHDLERSSGIAIIDADAMAADMGMLVNFPDGVHASGALVGEMRAELARQLAAYGIPGFSK